MGIGFPLQLPLGVFLWYFVVCLYVCTLALYMLPCLVLKAPLLYRLFDVPVLSYGNPLSGVPPGLGLFGSLGLLRLQKLVVGALYPSAHDNTSAF